MIPAGNDVMEAPKNGSKLNSLSPRCGTYSTYPKMDAVLLAVAKVKFIIWEINIKYLIAKTSARSRARGDAQG